MNNIKQKMAGVLAVSLAMSPMFCIGAQEIIPSAPSKVVQNLSSQPIKRVTTERFNGDNFTSLKEKLDKGVEKPIIYSSETGIDWKLGKNVRVVGDGKVKDGLYEKFNEVDGQLIGKQTDKYRTSIGLESIYKTDKGKNSYVTFAEEEKLRLGIQTAPIADGVKSVSMDCGLGYDNVAVSSKRLYPIRAVALYANGKKVGEYRWKTGESKSLAKDVVNFRWPQKTYKANNDEYICYDDGPLEEGVVLSIVNESVGLLEPEVTEAGNIVVDNIEITTNKKNTLSLKINDITYGETIHPEIVREGQKISESQVYFNYYKNGVPLETLPLSDEGYIKAGLYEVSVTYGDEISDKVTFRVNKASGEKEKAYKEMENTYIITNAVERLEDITMPERWSVYNPNTSFIVPRDNSFTYTTQVQYIPHDKDNYEIVTKPATFLISTLEVDFKNDFKPLDKGEIKVLDNIKISTVGNRLPLDSSYTSDNLEWYSSDEHIATVEGTNYKKAEIMAVADGRCEVGLRYKDTKKIIASTPIIVGKQTVMDATSVVGMFKNLKESHSVDSTIILEGVKKYRALSENEKSKISYEDYKIIDEVYQTIKPVNCMIVDNKYLAPKQVKVVGAALATEGIEKINYTVTPKACQGIDEKLALSFNEGGDSSLVAHPFKAPVYLEVEVGFNTSNVRVSVGGEKPDIMATDSQVILPIKETSEVVFSVIKSTSKADRIGDYGYEVDKDLIQKNKVAYPQVEKWATAGKTNGIMDIEDLLRDPNKITLSPNKEGKDSKKMNEAIEELARKNGGVLYLKNGTYDIDEPVDIKTNVVIIGESEKDVVCIINKDIIPHPTYGAFQFTTDKGAYVKTGIPTTNAGITRLTIKGGFLSEKTGKNEPYRKWNTGIQEDIQDLHYDLKTNEPKPDSTNNRECHENISVWFANGVTDCYADQLTIINSADFPVRCEKNASNLTWRDLTVDGAFLKSGGCHGYFFMLGSHSLITGCDITHIRHISIQGDKAGYNVLTDNFFKQEISFHANDLGNNLIEHNKIYLPQDIPQGYYAIMGPWAPMHTPSINPNYLLNNDIKEFNHKNEQGEVLTPWKEKNTVYKGPYFNGPDNCEFNFLKAGQAVTTIYYDAELKKKMRIEDEVMVEDGTAPTPAGGTLYSVKLPKKYWGEESK